MAILEKAPAKLNLGLRILGRRPDGYHDILSVFQTVSLFDELSLSLSDATRLECDFPGVPSGFENLVLKAADCMKPHIKTGSETAFRLVKHIPVGAGLGGGSSDAAAALRGFSRLHDIDAQDSIQRDCAGKLGSDVPFLLHGGTAVLRGRGESFEPVVWPFDFLYVLVYPGFGVSTAWAYGSLTDFFDDGGAYEAMTGKLVTGTLNEEDFFRVLLNDFEPVVVEKYPVIGEIKTMLTGLGARAALMSGSGSTVFGIFNDAPSAEQCADVMRKRFADVFVVKAV